MRLDYRVIADWVARDSSVLDLGCGDGELLSILVAEKGVRANGIEIDEQAIYKCVERGLSVFHEDIEVGISGYPDESFDYVVMNGSLQQVQKPDAVFREALRVGKKLIVGFPNFSHISSRLQMLFSGKVPVTPSLPYQWYDTPNLHFLSISDFHDYCRLRGLRIEGAAYLTKDRRVSVLPNLFAEQGLFLLSKRPPAEAHPGTPREDKDTS
ncbi:MAG: methionine biosynthesis protein MetW [Nitrososphaerota archaeon]|nr:methionine biosynthesis protein MetW [Nitrososphaerota archaeon]MDG6966465.1 methionine biosynthesis protein MetW [Nitrososphaerota archaeon]MDG6979157.1 methionine biosynthesis protein MetW [Nitrososphaerota archaeon]